QFIAGGGSAGELAQRPLWLEGEHGRLLDDWESLKKHLRAHRSGWDVWIRWYDAVLAGKPTPSGEELDIFRVTLDSEEDWKKSPRAINALIRKKEKEIAGREPPSIPQDVPGLAWDVDPREGLLTPVFHPGDLGTQETDDLERMRPFLLECANDLCAAIAATSSNSVKAILTNHAARYRSSIDKHASQVSIDEVYYAGVRLRNATEQMRREAEDEGMPREAAQIGEAVNSVLGLHGPFVLATERGRQHDENARRDTRTKAQDVAYKLKAEELAKSIGQSHGLVTEKGKAELIEINAEAGTGPFPERSTAAAEAANSNLLGKIARMVITETVKELAKKSAVGVAAIGAGTTITNAAIPWLTINGTLLASLAATSPETLHWLPHFMTWLRARISLTAKK
ncbi:MAG: hypothetical protein KDK75_20820, partial [Alphaproteobacteria bacterium]|nr:hypothetical protein [Alphaproteobacteria bacterium]